MRKTEKVTAKTLGIRSGLPRTVEDVKNCIKSGEWEKLKNGFLQKSFEWDDETYDYNKKDLLQLLIYYHQRKLFTCSHNDPNYALKESQRQQNLFELFKFILQKRSHHWHIRDKKIRTYLKQSLLYGTEQEPFVELLLSMKQFNAKEHPKDAQINLSYVLWDMRVAGNISGVNRVLHQLWPLSITDFFDLRRDYYEYNYADERPNANRIIHSINVYQWFLGNEKDLGFSLRRKSDWCFSKTIYLYSCLRGDFNQRDFLPEPVRESMQQYFCAVTDEELSMPSGRHRFMMLIDFFCKHSDKFVDSTGDPAIDYQAVASLIEARRDRPSNYRHNIFCQIAKNYQLWRDPINDLLVQFNAHFDARSDNPSADYLSEIPAQ